MLISDVLQALFRWFHVIAGVVWIGHLYFFNFVNGPFAATMDGPTKQKVVPELMPRALFWFRWGAAWTWITGVLLLLVVFYHGRLAFDGDGGWSGGAIAVLLLPYIAPFVYDAVASSGLGKDNKQMAGIGFVLSAIAVFLFLYVGGFGYRGASIHLGAMYGTIMAYNVWFRIWPMQQKIITATKEGKAPDAAWPALAGTRSRHNTYMSVPLLWTMVNSHTAASYAGWFGMPWLSILVFIGLGWWLVTMFYRQAAKVKGF